MAALNPAQLFSKPRGPSVGTVISAGRMNKTVKVQLSKEKWNSRLQKNFTVYKTVLVSDPTSALTEGDVISLAPYRLTSHVKHIVHEIVAPFGKSTHERPRVPTPAERDFWRTTAELKKHVLASAPKDTIAKLQSRLRQLTVQRTDALHAEFRSLEDGSRAIVTEFRSLVRARALNALRHAAPLPTLASLERQLDLHHSETWDLRGQIRRLESVADRDSIGDLAMRLERAKRGLQGVESAVGEMGDEALQALMASGKVQLEEEGELLVTALRKEREGQRYRYKELGVEEMQKLQLWKGWVDFLHLVRVEEPISRVEAAQVQEGEVQRAEETVLEPEEVTVKVASE